MTNESLRSIASLPKLEVLVLAGCLSIDDVGLQYLEHGCPFLKVLIECGIFLFGIVCYINWSKLASRSTCLVIYNYYELIVRAWAFQMDCRNSIFQDVMALVHMG